MPKLIAILGASASGKSALAHRLAVKHTCAIFSLDSLSIYKHINIAAAKPTLKEQEEVRYYALNILEPNQKSNAMLFYTLLESAVNDLADSMPLLIVGGSSFFLKSIINGLSPIPPLESHYQWVKEQGSLQQQYALLQSIDEPYARHIAPTDTYRISKALALFKATDMTPSAYFATHKQKPFAYPIEIFVLERERAELRERIAKRCEQMICDGIIDETRDILESYGARAPALGAIGPKECVAFLQGRIDSINALQERIFFHTAQLAKRQCTFNRTQFTNAIHLQEVDLEAAIEAKLARE